MRSKLLGAVASFSCVQELHGRQVDTCTVNGPFKHSIVSLHLCKEYLTVVKLETPFLLLIKY